MPSKDPERRRLIAQRAAFTRHRNTAGAAAAGRADTAIALRAAIASADLEPADRADLAALILAGRK